MNVLGKYSLRVAIVTHFDSVKSMMYFYAVFTNYFICEIYICSDENYFTRDIYDVLILHENYFVLGCCEAGQHGTAGHLCTHSSEQRYNVSALLHNPPRICHALTLA